jgi:hypothetical protein
MFKRIISYILLATGVVLIGFFRNYHGNLISNSGVWYFLSFILLVAGLYLYHNSKSSKLSKQEKYDKKRLERLKTQGEKIIVTPDTSEIRENSYYEEVVSNTVSKVQVFDAVYDSNRNYSQKYVQQSAIIFYPNPQLKIRRIASQSFPIAAETLRTYIENGFVILYINKQNQDDYMFELND